MCYKKSFRTAFLFSTYKSWSKEMALSQDNADSLKAFFTNSRTTLSFCFQPLRLQFPPRFFFSHLFSIHLSCCLLLRQLVFSSKSSTVYKQVQIFMWFTYKTVTSKSCKATYVQPQNGITYFGSDLNFVLFTKSTKITKVIIFL